MTTASTELIAELEGAISSGSSQRCAQMLRQVTDLFLSGGDRFNEHQIAIFDNVLTRLMDHVEARTLAQLSRILADLRSAPKQAVRRLADHEEPTVAAPVLRKSNCLSENDLIAVASKRGHQHILAISGRNILGEALTDVLLRGADTIVCRTL